MNMKIKPIILNLLTFILASGILIGCASNGYDKAASTANSLTKSADMIAKSNSLVDQSLAALNDLVSNPSPDLRKQYRIFNSSVDSLSSISKDVGAKAEEMKARGAVYFENWDKETATIRNEDIRTRSEARKSEVSSHFARIGQQYEETKTAFLPFISDLRDVQKFLSTDLTAGGLSAIREVTTKANADALPLRESLAKLSEQFKSLGISMSPTTPIR